MERRRGRRAGLAARSSLTQLKLAPLCNYSWICRAALPRRLPQGRGRDHSTRGLRALAPITQYVRLGLSVLLGVRVRDLLRKRGQNAIKRTAHQRFSQMDNPLALGEVSGGYALKKPLLDLALLRVMRKDFLDYAVLSAGCHAGYLNARNSWVISHAIVASAKK